MFRLYDLVLAPVLEELSPRRVVEIGALQGETTVKLLDLLGEGAEVHVIDPLPQFDPSEHQRRFPGRYHFHRGLSHDVLPTLPPVDAALIDGDHNWYTVYNELKMLAATAREAGTLLPLVFMHDVGWPYGRRDLYYAPERIPEEFRQPYAQKGVHPAHSELLADGGLNAEFATAISEGGARNGVMTAMEDFVAKHQEPLRVVTVPVYFGLAVVVAEERLASNPGLRRVLDALEGAEGRRAQGELAESLRTLHLAASRTETDRADRRFERSARRYLEVVKAALLDEHYLENEVRLEYLQTCAKEGSKPDRMKLRDPRMWLARPYKTLVEQRRTGVPVRALGRRPLYPYTTVGRSGLDELEAALRLIEAEAVPGDLAACGVWRGGSAIFIRAFLEAYDIGDRRLWLADTFAGPPGKAPPEGGPRGRRFSDLVADLNQVRYAFDRFALLDDRLRFLQGALAETLPDAPLDSLAMLHLGDGEEETARMALAHLYDRVSAGGLILVEHYDAPGVKQAVDEFRADRAIADPLLRTDWTGTRWRKERHEPERARVPTPTRHRNRAPLIGAVPGRPIDLSVVVVLYNMRREARRTLHSLSRSYQRDIEDVDYEVIVVENGSDEDEKLGEAFVQGFGAEFHYLDLGEEATASPAHALNRGIARARGRALALMIDGAHVITPGVIHNAMLGMRTYAPALVTTHQWYLGPGQQGEAMDAGYDTEYENRLFEQIQWPADGYRLFEIGNFIGDRDWFDGLWESNCLFAPRALLEQVGALDETFSMPGGGYANLDLFERLAASPEITVVGMLGEASFHQLHGGTTTNQPDVAERHARLMSYREHYEQLRGRPFRGPGKPRHFVGKLAGAALRTRPRWVTPSAFRDAQPQGKDGVPTRPVPVPEQLQAQFTDAFWRSFAWRDTTWLGQRVERAPTDLIAYQELIAAVRPNWIVEIRPSDAGALFFASICDLLDGGQVLSLRPDANGDRPAHPRITYVTGPARDREVSRQVFEAVGESNALLVIAPAPLRDVVADFNHYVSLVAVGSYAIVEGTVVNGHPVLPGYGPGPSEALAMILRNRRNFAPDHRPERFGFTFNPRGFLRRVG
jgi:cephalosporin hydroxylase